MLTNTVKILINNSKQELSTSKVLGYLSKVTVMSITTFFHDRNKPTLLYLLLTKFRVSDC